MALQLPPQERELVIEILQERHRELLREISRTNHREFKQVLKKNAEILESVLNKLGVRDLISS